MPVTTLGEEKRFNVFFRLQNPQVIAGLRQRFADLPEAPSPRDVFVRLRELRNKW
jgi:hydroxyacylglutathione hydrolase